MEVSVINLKKNGCQGICPNPSSNLDILYAMRKTNIEKP